MQFRAWWFKIKNVAIIGAVIAASVLGYVSYTYQEKVIMFWGDAYHPEDAMPQMLSFPESIIFPEDGPFVQAYELDVCEDNPLSVIPVRMNERNEIEALCGIGFSMRVETVVFEDELFERNVAAIVKK